VVIFILQEAGAGQTEETPRGPEPTGGAAC